MSNKVIITDLAHQDIIDLFQYGLETFGELVSEKYLTKLDDRIEAIKQMPGRGQLHAYLPQNLRIYKIDSHFIIYRYAPMDKTIHIIRVVHQNMDLSHLKLEEG